MENMNFNTQGFENNKNFIAQLYTELGEIVAELASSEPDIETDEEWPINYVNFCAEYGDQCNALLAASDEQSYVSQFGLIVGSALHRAIEQLRDSLISNMEAVRSFLESATSGDKVRARMLMGVFKDKAGRDKQEFMDMVESVNGLIVENLAPGADSAH